MGFGVERLGTTPLTWHWWSSGRCSIDGVPRLLHRQLRLRTGPLPSVPYLGPQARRWQRGVPASDLPTAESGSTQARWKPDPQASRAANPEPPSQRAEHRSCLASTAFPPEKHSTRVRLSFINRGDDSLAADSTANLMAAWKRRKIRNPRENTRDKVSYAHVVQTQPACPDSAAKLLIRWQVTWLLGLAVQLTWWQWNL